MATAFYKNFIGLNEIMIKKLMAAFAVVMLTGCVSLNSVSLTQVPKERSNQITSSADSWTFLGIAFNNDFVDEVTLDLKSQCPQGKLEGVLTKHQNTLYFLVVKREVVATAYCN